MSSSFVSDAARDVPSLRGVLVTAMPDCLLYDSWLSANADWSADELAAYLGDLFRANREGLKALESWSSDMQVTIEAPEHLVLLKEMTADFVCACIFEKGIALGMARLHTQRLLERISSSLPSFRVEERPRGVRIVEFLNRYAPDPHAVLLRASLRTGLTIEALDQPELMDAEQVAQLEQTACDILGLESLNI